MTRTCLDPKPTWGPDVFTTTPSPETVSNDLPDDRDPIGDAKHSSSSVPWPGSTFIIRSISSGHVITLQGGQIVLVEPGSGGGNSLWECVESKGWFGFRDPGSGRFLGHDKKGRLCCSAAWHEGWENFLVRPTPGGGYVMLLTHWEKLWYVGLVKESGVERLAKVGDRASDGIVWEFLKV